MNSRIVSKSNDTQTTWPKRRKRPTIADPFELECFCAMMVSHLLAPELAFIRSVVVLDISLFLLAIPCWPNCIQFGRHFIAMALDCTRLHCIALYLNLNETGKLNCRIWLYFVGNWLFYIRFSPSINARRILFVFRWPSVSLRRSTSLYSAASLQFHLNLNHFNCISLFVLFLLH